jgi:hypothetical protein
MSKEKTNLEKCQPVLIKAAFQIMAINTFKEMEKELLTLKNDVSFREYVGFEMCMQIFCKRYEKWIVVNSNDC